MKNSRIPLVVIVLSMIALLQASCSQERNPCLEPRDYFLKLRTYRPADTGSAGVDYTLPAATAGYVDTPLVFYADTVERNEFIGPLSGIADSVRWFILPDSANLAGRDTVTFYYKRNLNFLSTACGYTYVYELQGLQTTYNSIDSARIEVAEVSGNANDIHVKVFY